MRVSASILGGAAGRGKEDAPELSVGDEEVPPASRVNLLQKRRGSA